MRRFKMTAATALAVAGLGAAPAMAAPYFFSTGLPDGRMATASRPDTGGTFEIETADDFITTGQTTINSATFTGLIPQGSAVKDVVVEIYRVFPLDSDVTRTSGPPLFPTTQVPARANSP